MKHFFHKDILFSTVFVFLVLILLNVLFSLNLSIFNPLKEALRDFDATDIIFSHFRNPERIPVDTDVFLVNISNSNRKQIADEIRIIRNHQPKVIGLDATFTIPKASDDSALISEIRLTPQLVTANYFDYKTDASDAFDTVVNSLPKFNLTGKEGYINFFATDYLNTVRYYSPADSFRNKNYLSFSSQVLLKFDEKKFSRLKEQIAKLQIINYKGNVQFINSDSVNLREKFLTFDVKDIYDKNDMLNMIRDKIVLMGFIGQDFKTPVLEDIHFTPLNPVYCGRSYPDMYGVVIHANIIAMFLDNKLITHLNKWLEYILSFVICYIHMYFFLIYFFKRQIWFNLYAIIIQFASSVIIVGVALVLFKDQICKVDTTVIILPIILSFNLLHFYERMIKLIHKHTGYKTHFVKVH